MVVMAAGAHSGTLDDGPYGLYIHVPFCRSKCAYCDFYSVTTGERDGAALVEHLCRELRRRAAEIPGEIATVFVGGGTPTVLAEEQLGVLLGTVQQVLSGHAPAEFTVEANPATVNASKARTLVKGGVTRVSLGAQSFSAAELAVLEREHCAEDVAPSVATLRDNGINRIGLDLIFGIPGQTAATWAESIRRAVDLGPQHIACYGLTYEPNTRLTRRRDRKDVDPCDEQLEADLYLQAVDQLAQCGFAQYELSNFARPDCECRHNLIYWRNGPYIGVGPSAVGRIGRRRYRNVADVAEYLRLMADRGHAELESEQLDSSMLLTEAILMQLRLTEGLSLAHCHELTQADPRETFREPLDRLVGLGLLTVSDTHIALTRQGRLVANAVMAELVCACADCGETGSR